VGSTTKLKLFSGYRVRRGPTLKVVLSMIGRITPDAKPTGERSAGKPHAAFERGGGLERDYGSRIAGPSAKARNTTGAYGRRASPRP